MGVLAFFLVIIVGGCLQAAWDFLRDECGMFGGGQRQRLVRNLHAADRQIGEEASKARRAMNTAAGQDWRNRFE